MRSLAFIEGSGLTECCNLTWLAIVLFQISFAMRMILVWFLTMRRMDCYAKLGEGFQGAEHEVTPRKNYSRIPMVLPDFLEASTQNLFVRDLHLELPRITLGHDQVSFGKFF